ncbi:MAG: glycosyltransferase [Lentisphaeria bacterium]|nr:glycosyltransferase [Lentisphaeria bacterium]
MLKISVIVPVYNVERYLRRCLDSLIGQSLRDIEIICIDDGSPDDCGKILDEYAANDSRIKVIHQANGGLSAARNSGLKIAAGKYISFVDSDDLVDQHFLEKLYDAAEKHQADIAAASIIRKRRYSKKYRIHYTGETCVETLPEKIAACNLPQCCYVWNKLYHRELVIDALFTPGVYFEDVLWLPEILKKSGRLVTVPGVNYYYWVNPDSIVKRSNSEKKIIDRINSKRFIIKFFDENGLKLTKRDRTINRKIIYFGKIPLLKVKEYQNRETFYLLGILPIFRRPVIYADNNTFMVWEPCSQSHSEVVPGYVKYLLDLGYTVSVTVNPEHYDSGLFSRFPKDRLFLNTLSRRAAKHYFKRADLSGVKGILVTTAGKLCDNIHFDKAYTHFNKTLERKKLFLVEHDAKFAVDAGTWNENIITLRKLNYCGAKSCVVNPHYFGEVKITPKSDKITNFIMVGKLGAGQSDNAVIVEAASSLIKDGMTDFKITVVGKGSLDELPSELAKYVDIKGRLSFTDMFAELEKADFMLTSYNNEQHSFYRTTGASGNFQLVYGFAKPCIIIRDFAEINGFTDENSIVYEKAADYVDAMKKAIGMSGEEYAVMQKNLMDYTSALREESGKNLAGLIMRQTGEAK